MTEHEEISVIHALFRHRRFSLWEESPPDDLEKEVSSLALMSEPQIALQQERLSKLTWSLHAEHKRLLKNLDSIAKTMTSSHCACAFAKQLASVLHSSEMPGALKFLSEPKSIASDDLNESVESVLANFSDKMAKLNIPKNRLGSPAGPTNAEIGVVLHCQTKRTDISSIWDPNCWTIQTLRGKGLNPSFVYFWDWHLLSEKTSKDRALCPAENWTEEQRSLVDETSAKLSNLLPLPWLIVAGRCARKGYRRMRMKMRKTKVKSISLTFAPKFSLNFDIEIEDSAIKRIVMYVPHPVAGLYKQRTGKYPSLLDIGITFVLWLHGKEQPHLQDFITTSTKSYVEDSNLGGDVLEQARHYRQQEEDGKLVLAISQYEERFLRWAETHLAPESLEDILSSGRSIAGSCLALVRQRMSDACQTDARLERNRKYIKLAHEWRNQALYGSSKKFWNGEAITITKKGYFTIYLSNNLGTLQYRDGYRLYEATKQSSAPVILRFAENELRLEQDGNVVHTAPYTIVKKAQKERGDRWLQQIKTELGLKEVKDEWIRGQEYAYVQTPEDRKFIAEQLSKGNPWLNADVRFVITEYWFWTKGLSWKTTMKLMDEMGVFRGKPEDMESVQSWWHNELRRRDGARNTYKRSQTQLKEQGGETQPKRQYSKIQFIIEQGGETQPRGQSNEIQPKRQRSQTQPKGQGNGIQPKRQRSETQPKGQGNGIQPKKQRRSYLPKTNAARQSPKDDRNTTSKGLQPGQRMLEQLY